LTQAKTDSMQSNSASPKDYGRSGLAVDLFQEVSGPHALSRRSNNKLDAYFGILLMKTDFFSTFCTSAGMRVELSNCAATLVCYFTMAAPV